MTASNGNGAKGGWRRTLMAVAAGLALVFVVVLLVLIYIGQLVGVPRLGPASADVRAGADPVTATEGAEAPGSSVAGTASDEAVGGSVPVAKAAEGQMAVMPTPEHPSAVTSYVDPAQGFRVLVPADWQRAAVSADEDAPIDAADYDVVFEAPESHARIAFSGWLAAARIPLNLWVMDAGAGMRTVKEEWPTNAFVAGSPALVLWAPETPASPARYGAFLMHDGAYWRVLYSAHDGGQAASDFARALRTLTWTGSDGDAIVPSLPFPKPRYYPDARLFAPER